MPNSKIRILGVILSIILYGMLSFARIIPSVNQVYGETISAKAYFVEEISCGQILSAYHADERLPMASTTKIMTAYLALSEENLTEAFTVDSAAIRVEGTSMGLREGDTVSLYDLACGMLLSSGNDAANAAAVRIAGSIAGFVDIMNETARRIGMENTHFSNPSGLPDDNHYSTARDMAVLTAHALDNPLFAEIAASVQMQVNVSGVKRTLSNHNRLLKEYEGCIGVKTGFTKKAGRCLVSAAKRGDVTLVCVTLSAPDDWNDHKKLLDAGFDAVQKAELRPEQETVQVDVVGGEQQTVSVKTFGLCYAALTEEERRKVMIKWRMRPFYYAPIVSGQVMGRISYEYEGKEIASQLIVAAADCRYKKTERYQNNAGKNTEGHCGVRLLFPQKSGGAYRSTQG